MIRVSPPASHAIPVVVVDTTTGVHHTPEPISDVEFDDEPTHPQSSLQRIMAALDALSDLPASTCGVFRSDELPDAEYAARLWASHSGRHVSQIGSTVYVHRGPWSLTSCVAIILLVGRDGLAVTR